MAGQRFNARGGMMEKSPHGNHVGFCMGVYNKIGCQDCPTHKECLELWDKEQKEYEKKTR
jgi:hypothetical protein